MFPISISVDLLTNCIQLHIGGLKPDYKTKVAIKPMAVFKNLLKSLEHPDPNEYALENIWPAAK